MTDDQLNNAPLLLTGQVKMMLELSEKILKHANNVLISINQTGQMVPPSEIAAVAQAIDTHVMAMIAFRTYEEK